MINVVHFAIVVLAALAIIGFIAFLYAMHYDRQNRRASNYLFERLATCRASSTYWGEISPQLAQNVFCDLYRISWSSAPGSMVWHDEYTQLLEFFLAICEDPHAQVNLIYGAFEETVRAHHCEVPFKSLIWMEYTYDGHDWILWVDADRRDPDGSLLRNDGYSMFQSFGKVYRNSTSDRHDVCPVFNHYNHPTN